MEQYTPARVVTLADLGRLFLQKLWIMILAAAAFMAAMFLVIHLTFVPRYESTATLYILRQEKNSTSADSSDDFSLALKVVNDCDYLLKSHSVLDQVIKDLNLSVAYEDLSKCISTVNPDNTRILEVTVEADSPEEAKKIVDSVCTVGADKIEEAMGFKQVNVFELGTLDSKPSNKTGLLVYLIAGVVVAILVYTGFLVSFLADDRIHSEDDLEKTLGLSVLGEIPDANARDRGRYGHYKHYGYYRADKKQSAAQGSGGKSK